MPPIPTSSKDMIQSAHWDKVGIACTPTSSNRNSRSGWIDNDAVSAQVVVAQATIGNGETELVTVNRDWDLIPVRRVVGSRSVFPVVSIRRQGLRISQRNGDLATDATELCGKLKQIKNKVVPDRRRLRSTAQRHECGTVKTAADTGAVYFGGDIAAGGVPSKADWLAGDGNRADYFGGGVIVAVAGLMAAMVQVPALTMVTVLPLTVQMLLVVELKVTGLPEPPPLALTAKGASPKTLLAGGVKLMV